MPKIKKEIIEVSIPESITIAKPMEIIKVMAIQEKFVDQMDFAQPIDLLKNNVKIIGVTTGYVILKTCGKLYRISNGKYRSLIFERTTKNNPNSFSSMLWEVVDDHFKSLPQLFTT